MMEGGEERPRERLLDVARAGTLYGMSLPERALRGMVGAASGLLRESARAAVPDAMKGSKLYEITVRKMLGFLVREVGGLDSVPADAGVNRGAPPAPAADLAAPADPAAPALAASPPRDYMVKKALGNALDIAGLAALHVSPLWVIAVASDVVLGVRTYLNALGDELRRTGVLPKDSSFEGVDGLLKALQNVSGTVADSLDTPPVTVRELEKMVKTLRRESTRIDLRRLLPEEELQRVWNGIHEAARVEGRTPFEVSNALAVMVYGQLLRVGKGAVGSVKVGFDLLHDNVFAYYFDSLAEMERKGYYQSLLDASGPYLAGLSHLFEPSRESYTEKVLKGKPLRALWRMLRGCCKRRSRSATG
jgi:hypothetical protein